MKAAQPAVEPDDDLEALEQERDFLLRSLEDLEAEHDAGDIDAADYENLKDDYTARTATVLRAITAAKAPRSPSARRRADAAGLSAEQSAQLAQAERSRKRWRLAAIGSLVVVFLAIAGYAVERSSGSRLAGQSVSGDNAPAASGGIDPRLLQAANLVNQGKMKDALALYDQILKGDPTQPEALANEGWLVAQAGIAAKRTDLVDSGLAEIELAEKTDTTYNAAHFYRGYLLLETKNDPADAVTEFRTYLGAVDPSAPEVPEVEQLLKQAITAAGPSVPPGPNAPKATPTTATTSTTAPG